jgi:hypothetical protein
MHTFYVWGDLVATCNARFPWLNFCIFLLTLRILMTMVCMLLIAKVPVKHCDNPRGWLQGFRSKKPKNWRARMHGNTSLPHESNRATDNDWSLPRTQWWAVRKSPLLVYSWSRCPSPRYNPEWEEFDTWVIQAQYYWQTDEGEQAGSKAMCGPLVRVSPGG